MLYSVQLLLGLVLCTLSVCVGDACWYRQQNAAAASWLGSSSMPQALQGMSLLLCPPPVYDCLWCCACMCTPLHTAPCEVPLSPVDCKWGP